MKIGDTFWEYNVDLKAIYPRKILSESHIEYFKKGAGKKVFLHKRRGREIFKNP